MLGNTRLGWTNWCSKHQQPEEIWSMRSPITPSGRPNRCDESTSQRPTTDAGHSAFRWFVHTALLTGGFRDYLVAVDRIRRPTVMLLDHILLVLARVPSFPMALNRLAKLCDDLRCQPNPPRALGACSHTLQPPCVAPISNRRNVHIQQFRRCQGGVAPIASLPAGTESRPFGAVQWNVVGSP